MSPKGGGQILFFRREQCSEEIFVSFAYRLAKPYVEKIRKIGITNGVEIGWIGRYYCICDTQVVVRCVGLNGPP